MADPCSPGRAGGCRIPAFHGLWSALHPCTSQQLCFPTPPDYTKSPSGMHLGCSQGEAAPEPPGSHRGGANTQEMQQERRGRGMKENTAAHIKLARENQVSPPQLQIHPHPPRQPILSTAIFQRTSAALQAINSNIRIKKEVPDGARFSDKQAGSQQHEHTEHGQTSALAPPPPHPCFLFIPIFSRFFTFPLVAF